MRSVLRVLFSALLGIGIALAADHFFPRHKAENRQIVDTRKNEEKSTAAGDRAEVSLKTNELPVASPGQKPGPDRNQVEVRGYVVRGDFVNVILSDGRTITERNGIQQIARNSVTVDGQILFLAQPKDKVAAPLPAQPAAPADSTAQNALALPPPPPPPESSWETASDGVSRIKEPLSMASAFTR